jgi:hypothetical protein
MQESFEAVKAPGLGTIQIIDVTSGGVHCYSTGAADQTPAVAEIITEIASAGF